MEDNFIPIEFPKDKYNWSKAMKVNYGSILEDRERLLKLKEIELRKSKDWHDKVYVYKYIDNLSVNEIKYKMHYCRSNIYEILKKIRKNIGLDKIGL